MTESELLTEIRDALRENNRLLRVIASPLVEEKLQKVLHKDEERRVYRASDGSPRKVVGQKAGVSHTTVSNYWKLWEPLGILEKTETAGRYRHRYDVVDIALGGSNGGNS